MTGALVFPGREGLGRKKVPKDETQRDVHARR